VVVASNGQEAIDAVAERGAQAASISSSAANTSRTGSSTTSSTESSTTSNKNSKGAVQHTSPTRDYFDCILMDQEMPIKDGNAATIEIRDLQRAGKAGRSPILGVSANVREAQTQSMIDSGMDEVISKPFKVEDLVVRIEGLCRGKGSNVKKHMQL
jgi:CheY-like chemotaxis protein